MRTTGTAMKREWGGAAVWVPLALVLLVACGGSGAPAPLRPAGPTNIARDVTYCKVDGVALKMDIYAPQEVAQPAPTVLFVHGGGWTSGDKANVGVPERAALLAR